MDTAVRKFETCCQAILGLGVSRVWRGHGSALFLEFGELGGRKMGEGQFGLMIEWSWRIENGTEIVCGSWSDEELWQLAFNDLLGGTVVGAGLFGRLPEISVALSGDRHVCSFMTAEGGPEWALFDRTQAREEVFSSQGGAVVVELV